jgi:hypothetical protein
MPQVRYKKTRSTAWASRFNVSTLAEVLTGDDSPSISELDVWLEQKQCWKDMGDAFRDRDLITDNYNTCFFEPQNEEDRKRGFTLS